MRITFLDNESMNEDISISQLKTTLLNQKTFPYLFVSFSQISKKLSQSWKLPDNILIRQNYLKLIDCYAAKRPRKSAY